MDRKACELKDDEIQALASSSGYSYVCAPVCRLVATAATRKALEHAANIADANSDRDVEFVERLIRKEIPDA